MSCQKDFLGGPDDSFSTFVGQERDEKLIALSLLSCMRIRDVAGAMGP